MAVPEVRSAALPYHQLGLRVVLDPVAKGSPTGMICLGGQKNLLLVQLMDQASLPPEHPLTTPLHDALSASRVLFAVVLRVHDLESTLRRLVAKGVSAVAHTLLIEDGSKLTDIAWLPLQARAGTDLVLVQPVATMEQQHSAAQQFGGLNHTFPVRRLDHLAAVTHDLEATTRFWVEVLGIPLAGEVTTSTMIIRQFTIGDAKMELLGPAGPTSPIWQRQPGLVSLASWEVADLAATVDQVRQAGLSVSEPSTGVLPGTRIALIPATQLSGVAMQLLEYV